MKSQRRNFSLPTLGKWDPATALQPKHALAPQVTECGSQIAVNTVYRPCTIAARQVTIKKFLNHCLIEPMDVDLAQGRPVRKVRNASNVGTGGV